MSEKENRPDLFHFIDTEIRPFVKRFLNNESVANQHEKAVLGDLNALSKQLENIISGLENGIHSGQAEVENDLKKAKELKAKLEEYK